MGKIITPTYRIEVKENDFTDSWHVMSWNKEYGKPNTKNLENFVSKMNESYLPTGVNSHITKMRGYIVCVYKARIIHQKSGDIVAEWKAPSFQVTFQSIN